jgi:predicted transcriptional regulator
MEDEKMAEAKSGDLKLESPTFDVGEAIDVVKEDGSKVPAPDGEHQLELKDSEGNEVKIRVMVKDGKIMERENVEEVSEEFSVLVEAFATTIKKLETKLDEMARKNEVLEAKFKKFSSEPAGSRVTNNSTINQETFSPSVPSKLEGMRRLRESMSR